MSNEQKPAAPFGIILHGIIDSKRIQESNGKTKCKILVNIPGLQAKQDVTINAADYERLQVGEPFKAICEYNIFNNRIYWSPAR